MKRIRMVAALIIIGAIWGAVQELAGSGHASHGRVLLSVTTLVVEALWIGTGLMGAWLWTGSPRARLAATILLATQIPVVITSAATYWWHSPGQLALQLNVAAHFLLEIVAQAGPAACFWIGQDVATPTFGINFLALAGIFMLMGPGAKRG